MKRLAPWLLLLSLNSLSGSTAWAADLPFLDERFTASKQTGLLLTNPKGQVLATKDAQELRIPASTTKLLTAYLALQHWGRDYRFQTPFYVREAQMASPVLVVKGLGDPFLVSETLQEMALNLSEHLKARHITRLSGLALDTSYYTLNPQLPGRQPTLNPYDALPSALTANFNSVFLKKTPKGFVSAEPQTPLTPTALELAQAQSVAFLMNQPERINTGHDRQTGEQNFAEILSIFLRQNGIEVASHLEWTPLKVSDLAVYTHQNSKTLAQMIHPMMRYSTNFIANQLALNLSAEVFGEPASPEKVRQFYQKAMFDLGWQNALIEEGAGLSANNRLSPALLVDLLQRFEPYQDLLPEIEPGIFAKSGSLIGVSTLAGYISQNQQRLPFAIMMNEKTPYHYRNTVAKQLQALVN